MIKKLTPTKIFLLAAAITLILALLIHFFTNSEVDIAMHDMYIIAHKLDFFSIYIVLFLLFALISWGFSAMQRPLLKSLTWIQLILMVPGIAIVALLGNTRPVSPSPSRYYDSTVYNEFDKLEAGFDWNILLTAFMFLLPVAILVFLANVIVSVAKKKKL